MPHTAAHPQFRAAPPAQPAGAAPSTRQPAGNPSPECAAILADRSLIEGRVSGLRALVKFYAQHANAEEAEWHSALLKKEEAELQRFDLPELTDEARGRLARFGVPFAAPVQIAAE